MSIKRTVTPTMLTDFAPDNFVGCELVDDDTIKFQTQGKKRAGTVIRQKDDDMVRGVFCKRRIGQQLFSPLQVTSNVIMYGHYGEELMCSHLEKNPSLFWVKEDDRMLYRHGKNYFGYNNYGFSYKVDFFARSFKFDKVYIGEVKTIQTENDHSDIFFHGKVRQKDALQLFVYRKMFEDFGFDFSDIHGFLAYLSAYGKVHKNENLVKEEEIRNDAKIVNTDGMFPFFEDFWKVVPTIKKWFADYNKEIDRKMGDKNVFNIECSTGGFSNFKRRWYEGMVK